MGVCGETKRVTFRRHILNFQIWLLLWLLLIVPRCQRPLPILGRHPPKGKCFREQQSYQRLGEKDSLYMLPILLQIKGDCHDSSDSFLSRQQPSPRRLCRQNLGHLPSNRKPGGAKETPPRTVPQGPISNPAINGPTNRRIPWNRRGQAPTPKING